MERERRSPARRIKGFLLIAALSGLLPAGCQTATGTGALAGGALGAGIGALAGGKRGAVAGGLIGAGTGAVAGAVVDSNQAKKQQDAAVAAAAARAPSLDQIMQMKRDGVADAIVINQIRSAGVVYTLTSADLTMLTQNGVSPAVIAELQNTGVYHPVRRVYVEQPRAVIYEAPPPPPPVVGVGVSFR
jgi:hypothetical protein